MFNPVIIFWLFWELLYSRLQCGYKSLRHEVLLKERHRAQHFGNVICKKSCSQRLNFKDVGIPKLQSLVSLESFISHTKILTGCIYSLYLCKKHLQISMLTQNNVHAEPELRLNIPLSFRKKKKRERKIKLKIATKTCAMGLEGCFLVAEQHFISYVSQGGMSNCWAFTYSPASSC